MDEPAVYGPSDFLAADGKSTSDLKTTYVASLNCWGVCVPTMNYPFPECGR